MTQRRDGGSFMSRLVGRSFVEVDWLISARSGLPRCCFVVSVRCFYWRLGEVNPHTHQVKLCDFGSAKVLLCIYLFWNCVIILRYNAHNANHSNFGCF
uniref:Protein kinase domain-containing protein n=2 Tax=Salix viminalis TaxID=40686 RepID=A0A6N2LLK3_SALVM